MTKGLVQWLLGNWLIGSLVVGCWRIGSMVAGFWV
jgi:hypothetical protein